MKIRENPWLKSLFCAEGVTLVELLVALTIASILILGVIAAFQTTQRTAAIGQARDEIYQNARAALDLMSRELKSAYIDSRNRDLIFISADGLNGRGNSVLQYDPDNPGNPAVNPSRWVYGLGNAQTPFGIDPTGSRIPNELMRLYADETFGLPLYNNFFSIKAIADIYALPPGPPDRLDFSALTGQHADAGALDQSRMRFIRYMVTTETFVDDVNNDYDADIDEADALGSITGAGDLIPVRDRDDYHPVTRKILALSLFQLHRAMDSYGRIPARLHTDIPAIGSDWDPKYPTPTRTDENIGSYIYDVQFEFNGKIALALKADGSPEVWGVGWGNQDVRGEDIGTDCGGALTDSNDTGANAIKSNTVNVTKNSVSVAHTIPGLTADELIGGTFFVWPTGATEADLTDPSVDVYTILDNDATTLTLNREYKGADNSAAAYRIIEPTQANGILDTGEDVGSDGMMGDPLDDSSGIPNNVSNNNTTVMESSIGEGNHRLDSRVMGIWDSRSPDPRNPRRAAELNGSDDDGNGNDSGDDDFDNMVDDTSSNAFGVPESDNVATTSVDEANDFIDNDTLGADGVIDDRFYEAAGRPEGIDEPDEASTDDDSLPKAVRITMAVRDAQQSLEPIILSTVVWLSTAK